MVRRDYLLLFLAVGIMMGYTYGLDTPQSLQVPLRQQPYNFSSTEFNLIYFATFCLIGLFVIPIGILTDRYPLKRILIILLLLLLFTQIVISFLFTFTPPAYLPFLYLMRGLFGLGGEGLYSTQCTIVSMYAENEYEFIAGLALSLPFAFDALNSVTTTTVYNETHNLPLCWWIGVGVCFLSVGSGIWLNKSILSIQIKPQNEQTQEVSSSKDFEDKIQQEVSPKGCFKELKLMSKRFWVIASFIFFAQASLGPFNDNLNQLIVARFGFTYTDAGKLLLIPFSGLVMFTVICGYILKKNPSFRRKSMLVSTAVYLTAHFLLYFTPNSTEPKAYHFVVVIFFLFAMAFNFSIYYTSITPSISFLVTSNVMGTAWAVAGSAVGFSQCLVPLLFILIVGGENNLSKAYQNLSGLGVILAIIPLGFAMWINYFDYDILDIRYAETDEHELAKEKLKTSISSCSTNFEEINNLQESLISEKTINNKS